ncbi:hypothetical protein [Scatolibacter rhodanostii]|uniref:hypothetical protein n=1 Tax=Scatolibacter rhodanostii TaxID=2014781 RepID=UPI000C083ED1|nr:hypothetical protein [Scatolibacter rhodanostii]
MITLLTGGKGSGKTKKLIELTDKAVETSKGSVVVIEKGLKMTYDISHEARLVDSDAFNIVGADELFGFVSGICAGNYDVTDILIDRTLKIIDADASALDHLVENFKHLSECSHVNLVFSVSASDEEIPASLQEFILK